MSTQEKSPTKVTTGKVRLSYFSGWKPTSVEEGGEKKYSTAVLIDKNDTLTLGRIEKAVEHLCEEVKRKNKGKLPPKFKLPLRDGDEERPDDENYAGMMFLNVSSKNPPGIVSMEKDAAGNFKPITDEDEVYSGCYARVSMNFYEFDAKGNKGIAAGLNNIQKLKDGPKLAGGSKPEEDFDEEFELDEEDDMFK